MNDIINYLSGLSMNENYVCLNCEITDPIVVDKLFGTLAENKLYKTAEWNEPVKLSQRKVHNNRLNNLLNVDIITKQNEVKTTKLNPNEMLFTCDSPQLALEKMGVNLSKTGKSKYDIELSGEPNLIYAIEVGGKLSFDNQPIHTKSNGTLHMYAYENGKPGELIKSWNVCRELICLWHLRTDEKLLGVRQPKPTFTTWEQANYPTWIPNHKYPVNFDKWRKVNNTHYQSLNNGNVCTWVGNNYSHTTLRTAPKITTSCCYITHGWDLNTQWAGGFIIPEGGRIKEYMSVNSWLSGRTGRGEKSDQCHYGCVVNTFNYYLGAKSVCMSCKVLDEGKSFSRNQYTYEPMEDASLYDLSLYACCFSKFIIDNDNNMGDIIAQGVYTRVTANHDLTGKFMYSLHIIDQTDTEFNLPYNYLWFPVNLYARLITVNNEPVHTRENIVHSVQPLVYGKVSEFYLESIDTIKPLNINVEKWLRLTTSKNYKDGWMTNDLAYFYNKNGAFAEWFKQRDMTYLNLLISEPAQRCVVSINGGTIVQTATATTIKRHQLTGGGVEEGNKILLEWYLENPELYDSNRKILLLTNNDELLAAAGLGRTTKTVNWQGAVVYNTKTNGMTSVEYSIGNSKLEDECLDVKDVAKYAKWALQNLANGYHPYTLYCTSTLKTDNDLQCCVMWIDKNNITNDVSVRVDNRVYNEMTISDLLNGNYNTENYNNNNIHYVNTELEFERIINKITNNIIQLGATLTENKSEQMSRLKEPIDDEEYSSILKSHDKQLCTSVELLLNQYKISNFEKKKAAQQAVQQMRLRLGNDDVNYLSEVLMMRHNNELSKELAESLHDYIMLLVRDPTITTHDVNYNNGVLKFQIETKENVLKLEHML
jgi:hypothetical protein